MLTGSSSARFNEEICRGPLGNVKKWRDGTMALRWCAAGMLEADHQARAAPTAACPTANSGQGAKPDSTRMSGSAHDDDIVKAA